MEDAKKTAGPNRQEQPTTASDTISQLPAEFFSRLINQPLCRRTGECDNCGRCEH